MGKPGIWNIKPNNVNTINFITERRMFMANEDLSKLKIDKSEAFFKQKGKKKKIYFILLLILMLSTAILFFKGMLLPAVEVEVVNVTKLYPSQTFTLLNASGYVVAQRKAALASKITGRLVSISVEEGDFVKKGQIVARIENEDISASKEQAEANLNTARHNLEQAKAEFAESEITFKRYSELLPFEYVSRADYDAAEARYKRAKAAVSAAEANVKAAMAALKSADVSLEYSFIRAPFDGVVLTKNADIGDIITPIGAAANAKAAVVTIADMSSLQVEVDVSESNLGIVKKGQPCEIQLDAIPDSRFSGVVHMIVPTADRSKATVLVKIRFIDSDQRILPEMSAKAAFLEREIRKDEKEPKIALNTEAVLNKNGKQVVFLVVDNRAIETPVVTGNKLGNFIEILSGLKPGDRVVLRPLNKLKNGSKIKISEK